MRGLKANTDITTANELVTTLGTKDIMLTNTMMKLARRCASGSIAGQWSSARSPTKCFSKKSFARTRLWSHDVRAPKAFWA